MTKITYGNKTPIVPQVSHATQWWAEDANEVKDIVNENDTVATSTSNTVLFDQIKGVRHGTWATPITGDITLDETGAVEGGVAVVIWSGSINPVFIGGDIQSQSGNITESGIYSIYFHYINARFNINVFNVTGSVDVTAPVLLTATIENGAETNLVMVFSEIVTGTNLGFTINGTTSSSFASISGSGTTTITGVLGTAAEEGETITLDYNSATGDIVDSASNALASFTGTAVTNNVIDPGILMYQSDFSSDVDGWVSPLDTISVASNRLVCENPSGVSAFLINRNNNLFDVPYNINYDVLKTYRAEIDIFSHDAKYTRVDVFLTGTTQPITTVATLEYIILGKSNGQTVIEVDSASGDGDDFAGEEVQISSIAIYDMGVL